MCRKWSSRFCILSLLLYLSRCLSNTVYYFSALRDRSVSRYALIFYRCFSMTQFLPLILLRILVFAVYILVNDAHSCSWDTSRVQVIFPNPVFTTLCYQYNWWCFTYPSNWPMVCGPTLGKSTIFVVVVFRRFLNITLLSFKYTTSIYKIFLH